MKRFLVLMVVAVITIIILFFFTNPEFLDDVWLWLIGLIGYVLILFEKGLKLFKDAFKKNDVSIPSYSLNPGQRSQSDLKKLEEKIIQLEQRLKAKENQQS